MAEPLLEQLSRELCAEWRHIRDAHKRAEKTRGRLERRLETVTRPDANLSVVIFGSLARGEFTPGSDIDWTLLIDGPADFKHLDTARQIDGIVREVVSKAPGREGTFGTMAFSHEIIHQIGGQDDTNRNTTRRILLLLESLAVGPDAAYERVVETLLSRYAAQDRNFVKRSGRFHIPRFLLNDFARYWWTMAVDFAYKQRTRFGEGAAIRNIKLRMSRKMTYVSGLLTCFGCHLGIGRLTAPPGTSGQECIVCLRRRLKRSPLEILAETVLHFDHLKDAGRRLFDSYDGFIEILSDGAKREELEKLPEDQYESSEVFRSARELSHRFTAALLELFFDEKSGLFELTKNYAVF
jgi:predicted nucleotidyltransferase